MPTCFEKERNEFSSEPRLEVHPEDHKPLGLEVALKAEFGLKFTTADGTTARLTVTPVLSPRQPSFDAPTTKSIVLPTAT